MSSAEDSTTGFPSKAFLKTFLTGLAESGRVEVGAVDRFGEEDLQQSLAVLRQLDAHARAQAPGTAPAFTEAAALWAARTTYRITQALVFREIGADVLQIWSAEPCPEPISPLTVWSADLTFRVLPDLTNLALGLAPRDPILLWIQELARHWPLSSVGIGAGTGALAHLEPVLGHPSLLRLYRDRILRVSDLSRLTDFRVLEAVREALGDHPDLAPRIAAALPAELLP